MLEQSLQGIAPSSLFTAELLCAEFVPEVRDYIWRDIYLSKQFRASAVDAGRSALSP
jgi:hypothetical protein